MSRVKHIFDPVFTQNYWYIEAKSHKEYQRICKKNWNVLLEDKHGSCGEMVPVEVSGQETILIWSKKGDLQTIVHECMHAVSYCLRRKGIELTDSSEETFCYVIAFLFKEIVSNRIDKRIEIRTVMKGEL